MSFVGDSVPLRSYMPEAPLVDSASKARVSCCSERIAVLALGILSILFIVTGAALFIGAGWTTLPMIDVVVTLVVFGSVMLGAVLTRISSYGGEPKKFLWTDLYWKMRDKAFWISRDLQISLKKKSR